jgi:RHS repeat-associated protein
MVRNELLGSAAVSLRDLGGNPVRHYLYSGGSWSWLGDDIFLGRLRIAQVTSSGTRYFHVDHLGSVRRVSTGAGALEKAYDFFPYGLPVKETVGQERLWFASYELEHQNTSDYTDDLYFLHARWYFPSMGRFLSADPVRGDPAQPQSLNLFAYVTDNPLNLVDPWGLAAEAAMPPSPTIAQSQRDGVCSGVSSDPDCPRFHEEVEVIGRGSGGPSVDLGAYSSTQDLKNYYAWLAMQNRAAFSGSTITAHGFWRYAGQVVPTDPMANWQRPVYNPEDPMLQILGQVASTTQPWIDLGEAYAECVVLALGAEALYLAVQEVRLAYGARVALDSRKLHTFVFQGTSYRLPHVQLTFWRRGIPGSATNIRVPLPKWFSKLPPWQKYF